MSKPIHQLGSFLEKARKERGMTLRAVESEVGVSNAYLSQLEKGKIRSPSPVVLHKLSDLYGVSYASVLQLAGYPVPESSQPTPPSSSLAARIGSITPEEEEKLVEYLEFIRSKRRSKTK